MISTPILGLGFLVGMQHALEADHIAAVSSIAARETRVADIVKHGLTWGLGHTLTLFSFAGRHCGAAGGRGPFAHLDEPRPSGSHRPRHGRNRSDDDLHILVHA